MKLAAACRFTDQMQHWDEAAWRKYASAHLKTEIRAEQAAGGERGVGWPFEEAAVYRLPEDRGMERSWGGEWLEDGMGSERRGVSEWKDEEGRGWARERENERDTRGNWWESTQMGRQGKEWMNEQGE
ncbi:hypothetical protein ACFTAO_43700 [Paenibacillus rhizoplanae]